MQSPEDFYERNDKFNPLYYACQECGTRYEEKPRSCDKCGCPEVRAVYREDIDHEFD